SFSHLFDMLLVTNEAGLVTSVLVICIGFFLLISRRPPCSTLFPYTTLFRSMAEQLFGKRRIVGEPITLNGAPYTVVGKIRKKNRSEEHTSELQSPYDLVCRLLLEKKNTSLQATHTSTRCLISQTSHAFVTSY